jgi:hypothetical protein
VTLAALSAAVYGGVLAWSCALSTRVLPLTLFLGGAGVLLLGFVLVRGAVELLGSALLLAAAGYVVGLLVGRRPLDDGAPLVGAGLLLCAELATWSLDLRFRVALEPALRLQRARAVGLLAFAGLAAASLVVVVAATSAGGGLAWAVLGSAAAVGAIALAAFVRA